MKENVRMLVWKKIKVIAVQQKIAAVYPAASTSAMLPDCNQ